MVDIDVCPGVAAVVQGPAGVLLHRRRVGGGWAPPSGRVEPGESLTAAVCRELLEETTLGVRIERLVGIYSDPAYQIVRYPTGQTVHFITALFECTIRTGELRGSSEGLEWGWFRIHALPTPMLEYAQVWLTDAFDERRGTNIR